jgi:uncharacterized protein (TIGR00251 family)
MIIEKEGFVLLNIRVVPRASKSEVVGEHNGALRVRIASPPVDGAANAEVIKLLAKTCLVARSAVEIVSHQTSTTKQIRINGVTAAEIRRILGV